MASPPAEGESTRLVLAARIFKDSRYVVFNIDRSVDGRIKLSRELVDSLTPLQQQVLSPFSVLAASTPGDSPLEGPGAYFDSADTRFLKRHLRTTTVINSVKSGARAGSSVYFNVLSPLLKDFGVDHIYVSTNSPDSITRHATSFSTSSTVMILGGDTSLHEFVNALPETNNSTSTTTELRLCLIPTGSGNALASSLGIFDSLQATLKLFLEPTFQPLSSFSVDFPAGSYWRKFGANQSPPPEGLSYKSLVVASWGFHSALVADSEEGDLRNLGVERFRLAAERNASRRQRYAGRVEAGPQLALGESHSYLLVTGVKKLEPTFEISPHGDPPASNNLFLVYMPEMEGSEVMKVMMEVYKGPEFVNDPAVTYEKLPHKAVIVTVQDQDEQDRRWCVDGRIVVCAPGKVVIHEATHEVRGWALKILI